MTPPELRTCANCPATSPVPSCQRRKPKGPWLCNKCYQKQSRAHVPRVDGRGLSRPCSPEMAARIAELVRTNEAAADRFARLMESNTR